MSQNSQKLKISNGVEMITIPQRLMKNGDLVVVERRSIKKMAQENIELREALKAIAAGEQELRQKKTRDFKDFLKSKFPQYVENQ